MLMFFPHSDCCFFTQDSWQDVSLYGETDAYIVVYSVTDKETFDDAVDVLYDIRKSADRNSAAIILVANKNDMVRNRNVTAEGEFSGFT